MPYVKCACSFAITLVFCLYIPGSAQQQPQSAQSLPSAKPEAAIRALVDQFFAAYARKDIEAFIRLWSAKSPDFESKKKAAQVLFADNEKIEVRSSYVSKESVDGESASARVALEIAATDAKTHKPAVGFGKMNRALRFVKESGIWKVWSETSAEEELAAALVAAKSDEERAALLTDQKDLLTIELRSLLAARAFRLAVKGEYPQALATVRIVQAIAEQTGDRGGIAISAIDSTLAYFLQDDRLNAFASYKRLPQLDEIKDDKAALAHVLSRRGFLGYHQRSFARALDDCERSLALRDPTKDPAEIAFTLTTIGQIYSAKQNAEKALEYYQRSLAVCAESGDQMLAAFPLNFIGLVYYERYDMDSALRYYHQSVAISRALGIKSLLHYTLNDIGNALYWQGKYSEALDYYRQSLTLREAIPNRVEMARSLTHIGSTYEAQRDYETASKFYQQSLTLYEALGKQSESAQVESVIGRLYLEQGNYRRALEYFQKSLARAKASSDNARVAESLTEIGIVHASQGRLDLSLEYYKESLSLLETLSKTETLFPWERLSNSGSIAGTLRGLGWVYHALGKDDLALDCFQHGLDLATVNGNPEVTRHGLLSIGELYHLTGDYSKALAYYEKCLKQAGQGGDKWLTMYTSCQIGHVHYLQGEYAQ
ncbi:MAG: hypothetical protein DMF60_03875, partial [Acidobacteria bacterium]